MSNIEIIPEGSNNFFRPPPDFYKSQQDVDRLHEIRVESLRAAWAAHALLIEFPEPSEKEKELDHLLDTIGVSLTEHGIRANMHADYDYPQWFTGIPDIKNELIGGQAFVLTIAKIIPHRDVSQEMKKNKLRYYNGKFYSDEKSEKLSKELLNHMGVFRVVDWIFNTLQIPHDKRSGMKRAF